MGVITKLNKNEINSLISSSNIQFTECKDTINGITDSTYLGLDKNKKQYIFKICEDMTSDELKEEIELLHDLKVLPVAKVYTKKENIVLYENKPTILYSYLNGETPKHIETYHIKEIVSFLSKLHSYVNIKIKKENRYTKEHLLEYLIALLNSNLSSDIKKEFVSKYEKIKDIELLNDSIIHADLFPDNTKFIDKKLSAVFDFGQACFGSSYFDLAVLINSWCFTEKFDINLAHLDLLLTEYHIDISKEEIKQYMLYAALFYALRRASKSIKKDFNEYLIKFDTIEQTI